MKNVNIVDYSSHRTIKIMNQHDLEELKKTRKSKKRKRLHKNANYFIIKIKKGTSESHFGCYGADQWSFIIFVRRKFW